MDDSWRAGGSAGTVDGTSLPRDELLPCGVPYDDVLTQVADGAPPQHPEHQRTCPHCRAALAELTALWAPVHALAAEDVRAPGGLLQKVMDEVRRLPRHTWYGVLSSDHGDTRVAARVLSAVARLAASEVPAVALALGGGRTSASLTDAEVAGEAAGSAGTVGVAGAHVVIDMQIAVRYGTPVHDTAAALRRHVADRITSLTELEVAEVNIAVVDVVAEAADPT